MQELFSVVEEKLFTGSGRSVDGKKAIVREDTGDVIGVVGEKYKLVKHQEVLNSVRSVFSEEGLQESSRFLCKRGAVLFAKFYGNGNGVYKKEVKVGDYVRFGLEVFNSYDGSLPVGVLLIGERLKCSNGMVAPETISRFTVKLFDALELGEVRRKSLDILEKMVPILDRYREWSESKIDVGQSRDFFYKTFGNRYREKLFQDYLTTKEGDSVWDLYNYLTRWVTHETKTRQGNESNRRLLQWGQETHFTNRLLDFVRRR